MMDSLYPQHSLVDDLVHAAAQHAAKNGHAYEDIGNIRAQATGLLERMSEQQQIALHTQLRLYSILDTKDIAREMKRSDAHIINTLHTIEGDVSNILDTLVHHHAGITAETRSDIMRVIAHADDMPTSQDELYERLMPAAPLEKVAALVNKPHAKGWEQLATLVLGNPDAAIHILDTYGYIPHKLFNQRSKIKSGVQFAGLAHLHSALKTREEEQRGTYPDRDRTLYARSKILESLVLSGVASEQGVHGSITLDGPGIFINLHKQKKGKKGQQKQMERISAHVPYSYITNDLCTAMQEQKLMDDQDIHEILLRRAEAKHDVLEVEQLEHEKRKQFSTMVNADPESLAAGSYSSKHGNLEDADLHYAINPTAMKQLFQRYGHEFTVPQSVIRDALVRDTKNPAAKMMLVIQSAESVQSELAHDDSAEDAIEYSGYESYNLSHIAKERYKRRAKILRHPQNYDVARTMGTVLEYWKDINSNNDAHQNEQFYLFRGTLRGTQKDKQHSFIEIIRRGGGTSRVLIDPTKQLSAERQVIYDELPELNEQQYNFFETVVLSKARFSYTVSKMKQATSGEGNISSRKSAEYIRECNTFLLMEDPERYKQARAVLDQLEPSTIPTEYISICDEARKDFEQKLFGSQNPAESLQPFLARLERTTIAFDADSINQFEEKFGDKHYAWDKDLCRELAEIGHQTIVVKAQDRDTIPYAMEGQALEALQIPLNRPLITLVGGCRECDTKNEDNLVKKLCVELVDTASKLKANVGVPGQQSGIGVEIARAAIAEQIKTADLQPTQKAAFFAVSPGGDTYYPGSKDANGTDVFAMSPINSILHPTIAGWDLQGAEKLSAPYFTKHLHYAEDIFTRVSFEQPRVTVVGNGGFFTIADTCAALDSGSDIALVSDTGRFADLAIVLEAHRADLSTLQGDDWTAAVLNLITNNVPSHSTQKLLQEFGNDVPSTDENHRVYRTLLRKYFDTSANVQVISTTAEGLQSTLLNMIDSQQQKLRQRRNARKK